MNVRTLHVADIELPPAFERLRDLAYDYWWSWSPRASRLFSRIDPEPWRRYHNPVQLLINVEPQQWMRLLSDPEFMRLYEDVIAGLDEYRSRPRWFAQKADAMPGPVAYFSMEFGIHESLGIYSGGLGVLAGDHCKAASDLGVPLIGVGLLYRSGYFRQTVDPDGFQQHTYPDYDFARLPVLPVQAPGGGVLTVPVDLPGRVVHAAVWKVQVGLVPVLMLDTDIPLNDPADRPITGVLYVRGREMRLCQEIVHGIGGVRALRALGIHPAVWHMNEGHVAFLALERARERVHMGESLDEALAGVKRTTVFTTHTPVPAGNETFDRALVRKYLEPWIRDVGCEPDEAISPRRRQRQLQHDGVRDPRVRPHERREPPPRRGLLRDVAAPLPGRRRAAGRLRHERRPHRELGRARDADVLRAAPRPAVGAEAARARVLREDPRGPRRRPVAGAPRAEGAPHPLRARARARAGRPPRPEPRRAAAGRGAPRPARPDDRIRAPVRDVQARVPHHVGPRPAARDRLRPRPAGAVHLRGKGPPRRPRGAGGRAEAVLAHPRRVPRQARVPRGLRHRDGAGARAGLRRVAQHPAAAAGGERHVGPEGPRQRRREPQHPRRLVGRGLPRRQRLGDRRRPDRPRHERAGPRRRRVALPAPRRGRRAALLRPRRVRAPRRVAARR